MKLDADLLSAAIGCQRSRAALFSGALDVACARYAIDTPQRMAMFLAQTGHESGSLQFARRKTGAVLAAALFLGTHGVCARRDKPLILRPPGFDPVPDRRHTNAAGCGHVGQYITADSDVVALVPALLASRRPAAVLRAVWAVVVDSVERMIGARPAPHIGQEVLEAVPALAYANAACAVPAESPVGRRVAPASHTHPDLQLRAYCASAGVTVHGLRCDHGREPKASATALSPAPKFFGAGDGFLAAVADASPLHKPTTTVLGARNNNQSIEALSRQVNLSSHAQLYLVDAIMGADL